VTKKIHSNNGKVDGGEKKRPRKLLAAEGQVQLLLSPTRYRCATRTCQSWSTRRITGEMGKDGVGSTSIYKKTPI
jgi:hypothetical protein